jgi:23S rRNA (pseudouridine1915-N3)-methyltransferase
MVHKIRIVAVGRVKERYLLDGIAEYEKRLRPYCRMETLEIRDAGKKEESERLQKFIKEGAFLMDEKGKQMDSHEFAQFIREHEQLTLVVGGPEGLTDAAKMGARTISLSKMTFTHDMCRLFLIEQIYRAFMIISNRSYHK